MIIEAFSKYLQKQNNNKSPIENLSLWVHSVLEKEPKTNIEKIIHKEISYIQNESEIFMISGKSDSGRNLVKSLYNFAIYYENHKFSKWVHEIKSQDFKIKD